MPPKQDRSLNPARVILTVGVDPDTAARIKQVADAEYRSVAAEIRRLIEERVANAELPEAA